MSGKVKTHERLHENCEHFRAGSEDGKSPAYCQALPPQFVVVPPFGTEGPVVRCVYPSISDPEGRGCGEWKASTTPRSK